MFNPSNCESECDKSCNIGEYLDYSSCECRKKLTDPLVEECTENIDETELVNITVENENNSRCNSYLVYKMLFFIFFIISCGIIIYFFTISMLIVLNIIYLINHNIKRKQ